MSSATCSGSAEQPANNSKDNSAEPLPGFPALPHRAKLQGAVAGNWFAWQGVCTAENGWSIPRYRKSLDSIW